MRAGGFTVQQTLTSEAASVLKHSLSLARRRGHAQVTPLHVAATLLSSRVSLLRRACLKSHPHSSSHPLQCRALELCLNVALNRLPTTPGPLLHGQPSLSNALIAALKRAQAHQRRGCIEQQQQQPLLAIKVELEQLIISILDDPSVSRVMREAGFSSTCVKNNLEDSSSSSSSVFQCYSSTNGILSSSCSPSPAEPIINHSSFWQTHFLNCSSEQNPDLFSTPKKNLMTPIFKETDKEEDLRLVVEVLLRKKKRNTVIVGDSFATTECLVELLMGKVERGEVPNELRSAHFIKFQFPPVTLKFMKREDVEMKISDLRRKVGSLVSGGGAVIYAGDLKWAVEATSNEGDALLHGYNPVEHLVSEIGRLVSDYSNSNSKVWLMGTASYQTYMRCQMKQPSLEIQWGLQAVSVPSGGLGLSLHASSGLDSRMKILQSPPQMLETKVCFASREEEDKLTCCAECTSNFEKDAGFLRSGQQKAASNDLPYWLKPPKTDSTCKDDLSELRRKWNRLCHSLHHPRPNQLHSSINHHNLSIKSYNFASPYSWWPNGTQHNQESTTSTEFVSRSIDFGLANGNLKDGSKGPRLDSLKSNENKDEKITLALATCLLPEKRKNEIDPIVLNKQLQENVPWQSQVIPSITQALLESKSNKNNGIWLLIEGDDWIGKRRLAQTIVESLTVPPGNFVHMNLRSHNHATPCSERISEVLKKQETSVVLMEEIDYADSHLLEFLSDGCTKASFASAIFIVTKGDSSSYESENNVLQMKIYVEESLGDCDRKRKTEWDTPNKAKNQKTDDKGDPCSENVFSRQSSSNTLDLNMLAEEEDNEDNEEAKTGNKTLNELLGMLKNRFVFSQSGIQLGQLTENLMSGLKHSYREVFGSEREGYFSVDQLVIEGVVNGSGILVANLFEKWLKDIFQTSLQMVKRGGKEGIVRLSLDGKEDSGSENGYMGTNLPNIIPIAFKE